MTYGCVHLTNRGRPHDGAVASHSAELVRGDCAASELKAPSSALRAPSPQGEKGSPRSRRENFAMGAHPEQADTVSFGSLT